MNVNAYVELAGQLASRQTEPQRVSQPTGRDIPVCVWVWRLCQRCCETVRPSCKSLHALISVLKHTSVITVRESRGADGGRTGGTEVKEGVQSWDRGIEI